MNQARLFPHFELVKLTFGKVLYEPGVGDLHYAYFPVTCVVSLLYEMENGASAEMAIVGYDGVIGISHFMAGGALTNRAVVLSEGYAYRLSGHILMQEFNRFGGRRCGMLHHLLLHYTHTLITKMAQRAVCNQHHSVDQRFCNWLLLTSIGNSGTN